MAIDDLATRFSANTVRIQIVPQEGLALYAALVKKEAEIRKKGLGAFIVRRRLRIVQQPKMGFWHTALRTPGSRRHTPDADLFCLCGFRGLHEGTLMLLRFGPTLAHHPG